MKYTKVLDQVSNKLNLPKDFVDKVYKSYWLSIKEHIQSLPLKDTKDETVFNNLKININIPSIGKLYTTQERVQNIKENYSKYHKK